MEDEKKYKRTEWTIRLSFKSNALYAKMIKKFGNILDNTIVRSHGAFDVQATFHQFHEKERFINFYKENCKKGGLKITTRKIESDVKVFTIKIK